MQKAIAYCRVSSREQSEGYSLDAQYQKIKDHALKNDLKIVKHWKVTESAKKEGRKAFGEIVEYLRESKDVKIAIIEKIDRVARNMRDIVKVDDLIQDHDKEFHFVRENLIKNKDSNSNDTLSFDIHVILAKNYIGNLRDKVKKGLNEKIRQGGWPASAPIGYKNDANTRTTVIDKEKKPFIRKAFEMYATEVYSIDRICEQLFEDGLTNRNGKPVSKSILHVTLKNPFYIGKMRWKGEIYQGKHEPLVDEDIFYRVQEIFEKRKRPRKVKHNFLFSGLIKCGVCGSSYTTEIQKGKYIYYRCTEHYKKHSHKYWRQKDVEKEITKLLKKLTIPENVFQDVKKSLKGSHKNVMQFHNQAIASLQAQLTKSQNRKDQMYDDKLDGLITKEKYMEKLAKEKKREEKIIRDIKKHKKANNGYFDTGVKILELSRNASQLYKKGTDEEKRELLQFVFSNFIITNEKFDYEAKSPFSEIIKMNNRSDWSG